MCKFQIGAKNSLFIVYIGGVCVCVCLCFLGICVWGLFVCFCGRTGLVSKLSYLQVTILFRVLTLTVTDQLSLYLQSSYVYWADSFLFCLLQPLKKNKHIMYYFLLLFPFCRWAGFHQLMLKRTNELKTFLCWPAVSGIVKNLASSKYYWSY